MVIWDRDLSAVPPVARPHILPETAGAARAEAPGETACDIRQIAQRIRRAAILRQGLETEMEAARRGR